MKKCFFPFVCVLLLASCKESRLEETFYETNFYFDSPQPVNDSELDNFPAKYRGIYTAEEDTMYIDKKAIYYSRYSLDTISKAELDSISKVAERKGDKLIIRHHNGFADKYTVKEIGELAYLSSRWNDTVFALSPNHKVKRIDGELVISYKDSTFWRSNMLGMKRDTLVWKYFGTPEDYAAIKPFINDIRSDKDTTLIHLKPTRKEFKKLLGLKTSQNSYKKIK